MAVIYGNSDQKVRSFFSNNRHKDLLRAASLVFVGLVVGIVFTNTDFTRAEYQYTTIYSPNRDADATLLACRDAINQKPVVRLKYTGNDSPFIRMKVAFGPNVGAEHTQSLKKYIKNWAWEGSYPIPERAKSIKVIFTFDDHTRDRGSALLANIVNCTKSSPSPAPAPTPAPTPTPAPAPTPTPAPAPTPTPAPSHGGTTTPTGIKPLTPGTTWQWQLTGTIDTNALDKSSNSKKMYDIDLFDTPTSTISALKAKGITVICYMSAGTSENWRPDFASFPTSVKGSKVDGWAGENWLDVRNTAVLSPIMGARMDLAVQKGCDGIEPDNVDGYDGNNIGFPATANDQLNYNRMLAGLAHARKLSVGLKNDVSQINQLVNDFDWALNEQCYQYSECDGYSAFIAKNKAVFGVEYSGSTSNFCPKANAANFDWLLKSLDLGATPRTACRNG